MVLNKDEFLKEYNIDEKFLIDNNIDWNELEKIYNDYSMYRKSYETQANLISNILIILHWLSNYYLVLLYIN